MNRIVWWTCSIVDRVGSLRVICLCDDRRCHHSLANARALEFASGDTQPATALGTFAL
jgi:hypothetical protein